MSETSQEPTTTRKRFIVGGLAAALAATAAAIGLRSQTAPKTPESLTNYDPKIAQALAVLQEKQMLSPENITEPPEFLGTEVKIYPKHTITSMYTFPSLEKGIPRNLKEFPDMTVTNTSPKPGERTWVRVTMPNNERAISLEIRGPVGLGQEVVNQSWVYFPVNNGEITRWENSQGEKMEVDGPVAFLILSGNPDKDKSIIANAQITTNSIVPHPDIKVNPK